jgi:hypothetical protein
MKRAAESIAFAMFEEGENVFFYCKQEGMRVKK